MRGSWGGCRFPWRPSPAIGPLRKPELRLLLMMINRRKHVILIKRHEKIAFLDIWSRCQRHKRLDRMDSSRILVGGAQGSLREWVYQGSHERWGLISFWK